MKWFRITEQNLETLFQSWKKDQELPNMKFSIFLEMFGMKEIFLGLDKWYDR